MTLRRGPVRIGWFRSVSGAIAGAFIGIAIFFATVALLWWNEGRVNLANLARSAAEAPVDHVDRALDHRLVSVTAAPSTDRPVTDATFLRPLDAIVLHRNAQMYAWFEHQDGSRRTYARQWTSSPADSRHFREPRGHENPPMRYRSERFAAPTAGIGAYEFRPTEASLPSGESLVPTSEMLRPDAPDGARVEGAYVFLGGGTLARPEIGDLRLAYRAYRPGSLATLFGEQSGTNVLAYHEGTTCFYRLLAGNRPTAIETLSLEHRVITWMLRFAGFLLIWVAFNLALAPISAMFDLIPPLGRATRSLIATLTLPPAFAVACVIVVVSAVAHSPLAVTLIVAIGVVVTAVWLARKMS